MVSILEFRRPDGSVPTRKAEGKVDKLPRGHSAEIIIFPGVRIERRSNDGDGDRPARGAKRARRPARADQ